MKDKKTITVEADLWLRLNRYKYEFQFDTIGQVIRRLIELDSKLRPANELNSSAANLGKNNYTTPSRGTKGKEPDNLLGGTTPTK